MTCGVSFFILGMLAAAPLATAQYTCSKNTYLASLFTGGDVVTCNAVDQTSFQACLTAFGSATAATIIKIAAGSYNAIPFGGAKPLCLQGAGPSKTTLYGIPSNFLFIAFAPAQVIGLTLEGNRTAAGVAFNAAGGIYDVVMQNLNSVSAAPIGASMSLPAKLIVA
jgi:hypothetical protein